MHIDYKKIWIFFKPRYNFCVQFLELFFLCLVNIIVIYPAVQHLAVTVGDSCPKHPNNQIYILIIKALSYFIL